MKPPVLIAAFALLTGCATVASAPPGPVLSPATAVGGTPCDPPLVVPASIVASVRAQFEEGRTGPPPAITLEDGAAYQKMQAEQRTKDWGALCYFRADNAALAAQPVPAGRVVFMGDSITQLWGLAEPQDFGPARVNRGISGQTTPQMLLRFKQDVLALKPAAVHILAGVNDIAGNTGPTTLEDIENNIASMVELAKAHGVRVILATPLPAEKFTWAPQLQPGPQVAQYADWVRRYAAEQDLVLADYYPALATPDGAMKPELGPDGVHPNKAGYALIKPITQAAIAEALKR
ncbi:MAG: GDSL-type esterase/lipase family protein [Hyphomonadaceae bacterium]|nr:GDSL-type esterase/lipase family protein [Hyphomonadaceae bacterium]